MTTQSGNYRVVQAQRIIRLSDEMRVTLDDSESSQMQAFIEALEYLDRDRLGSRPSIRFCKIFDRYCSTYFPAQPE